MEGEQLEEQTLTPELAAAQAGYMSSRSGASQRDTGPAPGPLSHSQSREQLRSSPGTSQQRQQQQQRMQQGAFPGAAPAFSTPQQQQQQQRVAGMQQQPSQRTPAGVGALDAKSRIPLSQAGLVPTSATAAGALGAGRADQRATQRPEAPPSSYVSSLGQQQPQLRASLNEPPGRSALYSQARPPGEPQLQSAVVPRMSEAVRSQQLQPDVGTQSLQLQRKGSGGTGTPGGGTRASGLRQPQQQQQFGGGAGAMTLGVTSMGAFTEPDSLDSPGPDTARARLMQSQQQLRDPNLQLVQQQQPQLYALLQPSGDSLALNGDQLGGTAYPNGEAEAEGEEEDGHYSPLPSDFERPASQIMRPTAPLPSQQSVSKSQLSRQPVPLVSAPAPGPATASRQLQQKQQQLQQPPSQQATRSAAAFNPSSQPSHTMMTRSAVAPAQLPSASSNRFQSGGASGTRSSAKQTGPSASSSSAQWQQQNGFDLDSGLVGSESLASGHPETEQHYASTRIVPLQPSNLPANLSASNLRLVSTYFETLMRSHISFCTCTVQQCIHSRTFRIRYAYAIRSSSSLCGYLNIYSLRNYSERVLPVVQLVARFYSRRIKNYRPSSYRRRGAHKPALRP